MDWFSSLDQQIALIIHRRLHEAFENFTHDLMEACDYEAEAARFPLTVQKQTWAH